MTSSSVLDILKLHFVNGAFFTHVSLVNPKGKFQFNRKDIDLLFDEYNDTIYSDKDFIVGIAEKPQMYIPILVDVDIKLNMDDTIDNNDIPDGLYSIEQVKELVKIYQKILREIIVDIEDRDLNCILLEKKNIHKYILNDITYVKRGFHLHFPYIFLSKTEQQSQLVPRVKKVVKEVDLFANLGFDDSSKVIDDSYTRNNWLLYGSRKDPKMESYLYTKVFDSECNEISLQDGFKHYEIFNHKELLIKIVGDVERYLPRILSIIPFGRESVIKKIKSNIKTTLKIREKKKVCESNISKSMEENLKSAAELLELISYARVEDHDEWMDIGWALYNIGKGCDEALQLWINFSSRCEEKFSEKVCIDKWDRMVVKDKTIGTIRYYAKIDNPEKFNEWLNKQSDKHILNSLHGSHYDIAKLLYEEYSDEFVCSSISNNTWYQYVNHTWKEVEEGHTLRDKLSNEIAHKFSMVADKLWPIVNSRDGSRDLNSEALFKHARSMQKNLGTNTYKNSVMREAKDIFIDRNFENKLNSNPYLFAFPNGIYDLKKNVFRNGRPEDFVSRTAKARYVEYNEDDPEVKEVRSYLEKVFPDTSIREYWLDHTSDVFEGGNAKKLVHFWTGDGDNGKSVTQNILEQILGEYAFKFNSQVLTGKKPAAGAANADLARAGDGRRWAVIDEPSADELINCGPFKKYSGNDTEFVRDLFQKGNDAKEITLMFKMVIICNENIPRFKNPDKATFNRTRIIPFETTFCRPDDPAPEIYEEQLRQKRFPMDPNYSNKIPGLLSAFAWVLLDHRKKPKSNIIPEKVLAATAMYKKQNDINRQFIEENIVDDVNGTINITELYTQYKDWFKDGFPSQQLVPKPKIKEYFTKCWGEPFNNKFWKGYRLRTMKDEINDGNIVILSEDDIVDYNNIETPV